jgi:hypothetical protein
MMSILQCADKYSHNMPHFIQNSPKFGGAFRAVFTVDQVLQEEREW